MFFSRLTAALSLAALASFAPADTFPPDWGLGVVDEASGPVHFAPAAWPSEPANAADCGHSCGDWIPYTRFQGGIADPRVQDPSNGGTSPQNYVNVASSCIDRSRPSIYYHLYRHPTDATLDVLMFRWRVEQVAHTYATGPSAGSYRSSDPWNSALWTVLFDIDGDGYRDLAAHLDGSSGSPAGPIDMIAGIWGNIPTQSIDYLADPSIKLIAHNPTAFTAGGQILNFHDGALPPDTTWPAGGSADTWDYGTSRAKLVSTNACNEYFVDYQIPVRMLDASATGPNPALNGPKITRDTPISMLFCTANSLNNPFQKDCSLDRAYLGDEGKPGPFGDYLSFNKTTPYSQPIVARVDATAPAVCPGSYSLSATVQDTLHVDNSGEITTSVASVRFLFWADSDGDGTMAGDTGSSWTDAATASLVPGSLNQWQANWDATGLPKGKYLIGVQAVDDGTLHDDGVPDAPVNNRTFSYLPGSTDSASQAQIYTNPWTYDGESRTWISGGAGDWITGQQTAFPSYTTATVPGSSENWFGNPDVTGVQTALIGVAINACGVAPTLTKSAAPTSTTVGQDVSFTLTVSNPANNSGPVALTSLVDPLPAGFVYNAGTTTGVFGTTDPSISGNTLTWSGSTSIAPGASATLSFTAKAPTVTGTYTNTASGTSDFGPLASEPVQIGVGAARLSLAKSASSLSLNQGDPLTWTLIYSNDSPIDAHNVVLTDVLPDGIATASCSGGCVCADNDTSGTCNAGDTLSWSIGTLTAGEGPYSVTVSTTVANPYPGTAPVPLTNTASIDSDDTTAVQASAASHVNVPRPELSLSKVASSTLIAPGAQVTYALSWRNSGSGDASGVVLTDVVPAGFSYVSCTGGCSESAGTVTWPLSTVASGGSGSATLTLQADNPFTAIVNPVTNTASLDSDQTTPVTDSAEVGVSESGNLCRTYYLTGNQGDVGSAGTQYLTSTTASTGSATTLQVAIPSNPNPVPDIEVARFYQDPASGQLVNFNGTSTFSGQIYYTKSAALGGSANANLTLKVSIYDYDPVGGAQVLLGSVSYTDNGSPTPPVSLSSVAPSGAIQKDHRLLIVVAVEMAQNKDTTMELQVDSASSFTQICAPPPANLVLEKQASVSSVANGTGGQQITYTIDYANTSAVTQATNVVLTDALPAGTSYASNTGGGSHDAGTPGNVTWNLGTLAGGATGSVSVTVDVNADLSAFTELVNTATIASTETSPRSASARTLVEGSGSSGTPKLVISKSVDDTSLVASQVATYTLTVLNAGDGAASGVTVSDVLPVTADYTYTGCTTATGTCNEAGGTLTWTPGTLAAGASATATVTMQVAASPASGIATLDNQATVADADYCTGGSPPASCTSGTVTVSISTNPNLSISKSASAVTPAAGDTVTYTLVVSNTGTGAAEDVVVRDPILSYMRFADGITASAGSGSFDPVGNRVVFDVGTLAGGASETLKFNATIVDVMPSGTTTLTNVASVSASNSPLRTASAASTVSAGPILSITKNGPASLPLPAARLSSAASAASQVFVDDASRLGVGDILRINGTQSRIVAIAGNSLTLDTAVTASIGEDVLLGATWSLTYRNQGTADASGVVVTDILPAGWRYVGASPAATTAPAVDGNGTVTWSIGALAAGASGTVQIEAIPTTAGSHTNQATIADADYCTGGSPPAGCSSDLVTTVGGLTAEKSTTTPLAAAGGTADWTIVVRNDTTSPVTPVTVLDELPAGFTYQAGTTTIDSSPAADPTLVSGDAGRPQWTVSVPASGSKTIRFTADIDASVGPATYQNGVVLGASGVGLGQFDALRTTAEDVTVLAAGTGLVEGIVYRDLDGNGDFDPAVDTPLTGVAVTLIDDTATAYVALTDGAGRFSRVVSAGSTIVDVDDASLPAGVMLTTGADGSDPDTVLVPDGGSVRDDTGYVAASGPRGALSGTVWLDTDRNQSQGTGESGVLGIAVQLRNAVGGALVATAYTDQLGRYSFPSVAAGSYLIDPVVPASHFLTTANDPAAATVSSGSSGGANFGIALGRSLSGQVFADDGAGGGTAGDAIANGSEVGTGLAAPRVVVTDGSNVVLAVASVPANGQWSAGVPAGSGYRAVLTTASPTVGSTFASAATTSSGWQSTGENRAGLVDGSADGQLTAIDASSDVTGLNFGVEMTVVAVPDVFATVDAPDSVAPGDTVSLLVGFGNQGTATADGLSYTLQLPTGLAGVNCSDVACLYDPATGLVVVTGLPTVMVPGQRASFGLSYTAPASGPLGVTASIATTTGGETPTANNSANDSTLVTASVVDVAVRVDAPPTALAGSPVSADLVFTDLGAVPAGGMVYTATLPGGLAGVVCSGNGIACSYDAGSGALTLSGLPTTLSVGQQVAVRVRYTAPASGSVTLSGTTNATGDAVAGNNSDSDTTVIITSASVPDVYSLVAAPATSPAGGQVAVVVRFGNLGPDPATPAYTVTLSGATVSDVEFRYRGTLCTWNSGSGALSGCGLPTTVQPGEHFAVDLSYIAPASGSVTVASTVSAAGESHLANNPSAATTTVSAALFPDVIALIDAPASIAPGDRIRVLVTYGNQGPATAEGVAYRLLLPAGLTDVTCSGASCDYDASSGMTIVTGLPTILSTGMQVDMIADFTAPAGLATALSAPIGTHLKQVASATTMAAPSAAGNTLTLNATAIITTTTAGETPTSNNQAEAPTTLSVGTVADVTTWVTAPATAAPGATVHASASFTNLGVADASGVGYAITGLPAGTAIQYKGVACSFSAGTVSGCNLPTTLAQGQVVSLDITYTAPASGSVTAFSTVSAGNDADPSNNTDRATTVIAASVNVDLATTVTAPVSASAGSLVVSQLTYTNGGPASGPVSSYGLSLSGAPGSVTVTHQGVTCTWNGSTLSGCNLPPSLAPGERLDLVVTYTAPSSGSVTATSTIATPASDTNPANNTSQATTAFSAAAPTGAIAGTVWYDLDSDNVVDTGEPRRPGWIVELLAEGMGGELLVGRVTTAADGSYQFSGLANGSYTVRFLNPLGQTVSSGPMPVNGDTAGHGGLASVSQLSGIRVEAGVPVVNQSLPLDPSGVVYSSTTRQPISGAQVTLSGPPGFDATDLVGSGLTQTTGADGLYQFLLLPSAPAGTYTLAVTAAGFTFQSTAIPPTTVPGGFTGGDVSGVTSAPAVGQNTTYYLSFPRPTVDMINNNIPVDPPPAPPPGGGGGSLTSIPTLSEWGMLLLVSLMMAAATLGRPRARVP
ncbi:MAG: IPTL-CTERM sorting domain-containing protein [Rhodocyclaceae bacterium]|nr:IPTL-CTERM sorting domain-containing protein [Rhodocyclaceae bacterium]